MLTPSCPASRALVEWVEHGVADALRRGYLRRLTFGVAADAACSYLLEEFVFHFGYGDDGATPQVVGMASSTSCGVGGGEESQGQNLSKGGNGTSHNCRRRSVRAAPATASTVASVKHQIVTLIRTLVQVCHTLDAVPEDRFLFMKLGYRDEVTPIDYEPPCFRAAAPSASEDGHGGDGPRPGERAAFFPRKPFSIEAGRVQTADHAVVICVKSTLDGAAPAAAAAPAGDAAGAAAAARSKKKNGGVGGGGRGNDEENDAAANGLFFGGGGSQPVPEDGETGEEEGDCDDVSMTVMSDDDNDEEEGEEGEELNDGGKIAGDGAGGDDGARAPKKSKKPAFGSGPASASEAETLERVRAWVAAKAKAAAAASAPAAAAAVPKKGGRRGAGKLSAMAPPPPPPPPPAVPVAFIDALAHFADATIANLKAAFDALAREGVLVRAAGGGEEEFAVAVGGGGGGGGASVAGEAATAADDEVEATGRRLAALSCHGGVASAAGTEKTASLAASGGRANSGKPASAPSVANPGVHFEETRPSPSRAVGDAAKTRKRKLSIVKAPIQTVKGVSRVVKVAAAAVAVAAAAGGGAKEASEEEEEATAAQAPAKRAARGRGASKTAAAVSAAVAGADKTSTRRRK